MKEPEEPKRAPKMMYSCYAMQNREGEQFMPEHIFAYLLAGTMAIRDDEGREYLFRAGEFVFYKRNHLLKYVKQPPADGGDFRAVSIHLDQEALRSYSMQYNCKAESWQDTDAVLRPKHDTLCKNFMEALVHYAQISRPGNEDLLCLKQSEAIMLLLRANPEMKEVLFDFNEPGKIDLEAFMNSNFHFNVELKRFAYLSGRSLTTFKRDFEKTFHTTPSRWLQKRRLQEAYYLLKEKGKKSSEVYLEVGFEDLSHFSFAFKKTFGVAPSVICTVPD